MQGVLQFALAHLQIVITLILIGVGFYCGKRTENRHFHELSTQEQALSHIIVSTERRITLDQHGKLVMGSVVLAQDHFKHYFGIILSVLGKNLTTHETILQRARREALLRAKIQAHAQGAHHIYGLRFETTNIGNGIEVIAYGTAVL